MSAWFKIIDPSDGSELTEGTGNKTINIKRLKENTGREDYEETLRITSTDRSIYKDIKVIFPKLGNFISEIPNKSSGIYSSTNVSVTLETNLDPTTIKYAIANFKGTLVNNTNYSASIKANFFEFTNEDSYQSIYNTGAGGDNKGDFLKKISGANDEGTAVGQLTTSRVMYKLFLGETNTETTSYSTTTEPGPIYTDFFSNYPETISAYKKIVETNDPRENILGIHSKYTIRFEINFETSSEASALYKQGVLLYLQIPRISKSGYDLYIVPVYREASDTPVLKIFKDESYKFEVSNNETLTITEEFTPLWIQTNTSWMANIN